MEIEYFNEDIDLPEFSADRVFTTILHIAESENTEFGFLNIIFCSDEYLLDINKQYLDHDYYTDIITFQYDETDNVSSDIFISLDRVAENASDLSVPFENEFYRIIIHGVLHLSGYKDKEEADKLIMTQKEDKYLSYLLTLSNKS